MFIGHFAVGFAAKRAAPEVSLGVLIGAASLLDLLWPVFLLLGWERVRVDPGNTAFTPLAFDSYPISHSLLAAIGWSALCGLLYWAICRDGRGTATLVALVVSHWALDALSHRPDLPLTPTGLDRVGLGLWNSVPATLVVEGAMFVAGVWLYAAFTRARNRVGRWAFVTYVSLLALLYFASVFGPPPPNWQTIAWSDLAATLFVVWAAWLDWHREVWRRR
jgi:membrane-bound metal-dependent hydrolase YbcI (DUF457 family)